ncbi:MAG: substrate-binding domain-containing protein [Eubacteriales bacterium]|nr:substrate-binding domain-containing protein [Eubacteriales bacterium]
MSRKMLRNLLVAGVAAGTLAGFGMTGQAADGGYTFAMLVPTMNHEYFENCVSFANSCAEAFGCTVNVYNADNNADTMSKNVEDAIAAGVDGILIDPYYASGMKCAEMCEAAGIPMIAFDSDIEEFGPQGDYTQYISFIGPDDADAGYNMACNLFDMATPDEDGTIYVGVVQGTPGTAVAINREVGFDKALAEYTDKGVKIEVVGRVNGDFAAETSLPATEDLLQKAEKINGIWAANGGTATGVMAACKNAGLELGKDITIVGMDLNSSNVKAVEDGELQYDIGGHWLIGGYAVIQMVDYLNGYEIKNPKTILKLLPITQDTVDKFYKDYPDNIPANFDIKAASQANGGDAEYSSFEFKFSE